MEKLLGEIVGQRIMLAQLLAYVANQQMDREAFITDFREASLRSLDRSLGGAAERASNDVLPFASKIIEDTCDTAGRAV
jgi:hypothetical protein